MAHAFWMEFLSKNFLIWFSSLYIAAELLVNRFGQHIPRSIGNVGEEKDAEVMRGKVNLSNHWIPAILLLVTVASTVAAKPILSTI